MTLSLTDALGVVIGFITVILLLSMVVTSLVQITQSVFRTRGRNLHRALWRVMVKDLQIDEAKAKGDAHRLLGNTLASLVRRETGSDYDAVAKFLGPAVSWLGAAEIPDALKRAKLAFTKGQIGKLQEGLRGMELPMRKRLGFTMRWISIGWAVVVAFAFQVSSLDLLRDLSADKEAREQVLALSREQIASEFQDPAAQALARLEKKNDQLRALAEEKGDFGTGGDPIRGQLEKLVKGRADAIAILDSYDEELLGVVSDMRAQLARLSPLSVELWSKPDFYMKDWIPQAGNIVGVAITALLLTFGAPFWFGQLKVAVGLRDALRAPPETGDDGAGQ